MAQVAKLSVNSSSVSSHGFTRCPDLDFKDDGNRFTGWMWNDAVPLTQCVSGGETFLSVRDDYMRSNAGLPYHFWEKYEESKLGDKYNGTSEKIDLDELAEHLPDDKCCFRKFGLVNKVQRNLQKSLQSK